MAVGAFEYHGDSATAISVWRASKERNTATGRPTEGNRANLTRFRWFLEPFSRLPRTSTDMTAITEPPHTADELTSGELDCQTPVSPAEPKDFSALVLHHQAGVWRYVRFLGADAAEADDLTQETFLALARAEFVEHDERQTAGYLRVVARNQLLALRRKQ